VEHALAKSYILCKFDVVIFKIKRPLKSVYKTERLTSIFQL